MSVNQNHKVISLIIKNNSDVNQIAYLSGNKEDMVNHESLDIKSSIPTIVSVSTIFEKLVNLRAECNLSYIRTFNSINDESDDLLEFFKDNGIECKNEDCFSSSMWRYVYPDEGLEERVQKAIIEFETNERFDYDTKIGIPIPAKKQLIVNLYFDYEKKQVRNISNPIQLIVENTSDFPEFAKITGTSLAEKNGDAINIINAQLPYSYDETMNLISFEKEPLRVNFIRVQSETGDSDFLNSEYAIIHYKKSLTGESSEQIKHTKADNKQNVPIQGGILDFLAHYQNIEFAHNTAFHFLIPAKSKYTITFFFK
jgi:hypothetical protein